MNHTLQLHLPNANKSISIGNHLPLTFILGPCVIESEKHSLLMAESIALIAESLGVNVIFKSSFDKANRTSVKGFRGTVTMQEGLKILKKIKNEFNLPVLTDIHNESQAALIAEHCDVIQIPAFLCRQTDLLEAVAKTGACVNIKKGQFLAPWDMQHVVNKMRHFGNHNVMVCERGVSFGYNMLVTDFRSLPIMKTTCNAPVIFDATHSVQLPGGQGESSGGERKYVSMLAKMSAVAGIAGIFMEVHNDPNNAPSDGPNMLDIKDLKGLMQQIQLIDSMIKA